MENNNKKEEILEIKKQKEQADKLLLRLEWVIGYISVLTFLVLVLVSTYIEISAIIRGLLITFGSIVLVIGIISAIKIEQVAGYYKCRKCEYIYIYHHIKMYFLQCI